MLENEIFPQLKENFERQMFLFIIPFYYLITGQSQQ